MVDRAATSCYTNSMNTQITLSQPVWPLQGRILTLVLTSEGVVFNDPCVIALPLIPWDKVDDVEFLAEEFREMKVYEFQALCTALGKAYLMKGVVTGD
jgi:hypothetical protein